VRERNKLIIIALFGRDGLKLLIIALFRRDGGSSVSVSVEHVTEGVAFSATESAEKRFITPTETNLTTFFAKGFLGLLRMEE